MLKKAAIVAGAAAAAAFALAPLGNAQGSDYDFNANNAINCDNTNATPGGGLGTLTPAQTLLNFPGGNLTANQSGSQSQAGLVKSPQKTHCGA
jgi:hypothetical protein